jgi:hypothetical protein
VEEQQFLRGKAARFHIAYEVRGSHKGVAEGRGLLVYYTIATGKYSFLSLYQWRTGGGGCWGVNTPRNCEFLTKLSRIPSAVENTSGTFMFNIPGIMVQFIKK